MDEVRIWNVARSTAQIQADRDPHAHQRDGADRPLRPRRGQRHDDHLERRAGAAGRPRQRPDLDGAGAAHVGDQHAAGGRLGVDHPGLAAHNDPLSAVVTSHDADGDALTTAYQWTRNGTDIAGATSSTLDLATAGNGDKRRRDPRAGDRLGRAAPRSAPVTSTPVTVLNTVAGLHHQHPGPDRHRRRRRESRRRRERRRRRRADLQRHRAAGGRLDRPVHRRHQRHPGRRRGRRHNVTCPSPTAARATATCSPGRSTRPTRAPVVDSVTITPAIAGHERHADRQRHEPRRRRRRAHDGLPVDAQRHRHLRRHELDAEPRDRRQRRQGRPDPRAGHRRRRQRHQRAGHLEPGHRAEHGAGLHHRPRRSHRHRGRGRQPRRRRHRRRRRHADLQRDRAAGRRLDRPVHGRDQRDARRPARPARTA